MHCIFIIIPDWQPTHACPLPNSSMPQLVLQLWLVALVHSLSSDSDPSHWTLLKYPLLSGTWQPTLAIAPIGISSHSCLKLYHAYMLDIPTCVPVSKLVANYTCIYLIPITVSTNASPSSMIAELYKDISWLTSNLSMSATYHFQLRMCQYIWVSLNLCM